MSYFMDVHQTKITLDLTGQICPWPVINTNKELKKLNSDEILEVFVDHMPSTLNIPASVKKDGHLVVDSTSNDNGVYKITIQKK